MKYPLYILGAIILFSAISLSVVMAATNNSLPNLATKISDNSFSGVIAKLDEVKQAILGLPLSIPSPLNVNVTNFPENNSQNRQPKLIKVIDSLTLPDTSAQLKLASESINVEGYTKGSMFVSIAGIPDQPSNPTVSTRVVMSHDGVSYYNPQNGAGNVNLYANFPAASSPLVFLAPYARIEISAYEELPNDVIVNAWLYLMP